MPRRHDTRQNDNQFKYTKHGPSQTWRPRVDSLLDLGNFSPNLSHSLKKDVCKCTINFKRKSYPPENFINKIYGDKISKLSQAKNIKYCWKLISNSESWIRLQHGVNISTWMKRSSLVLLNWSNDCHDLATWQADQS